MFQILVVCNIYIRETDLSLYLISMYGEVEV
jgi:hypothetical protein